MNKSISSEIVGEFTLSGERSLASESRPYFASNARGIERLVAVDDQTPGRPEIDWEAIHQVIEEKLASLTRRVADLIPHLTWRAGSYRARHVALSCYRTFGHLDGNDLDPVYAGLTIVEEDGRLRVSGDISGEESGRIFFDRDCERLVADDHSSLLAAVVDVAGRISEQQEVVSRAIRGAGAVAI